MKTLLVVEDNPSHLALASLLLERAGYAVLGAASAGDGLRLAEERQPALILMDLHLPDLDGLEAIRCLKQSVATRAIPVIIVTAYLAEYSETDLRAAGCAGVIAKPYHYQDFLAAIDAALAGSEG
jgi:two-component system, cell cycle response regulator DivK